MILSWEQLQDTNKIIIRDQGYIQDYDVARLNGDLSTWECHYSMCRILPLTWISNLSRFKDPGDWQFSESRHLARYVSRHNAMAYDTRPHE
jgi:hypothetical protein